MRSRAGFIARGVPINLRQSGTPIILVWKVWGTDATIDPVSGMKSGTPAEMRECTQAFLHFTSASAMVRQFNEIAMGDCIMDLNPHVQLTGRDNLVYLLPQAKIEGGSQNEETWEEWVNKPMSSELASYWDTMMGRERIFQTVLIRRAT